MTTPREKFVALLDGHEREVRAHWDNMGHGNPVVDAAGERELVASRNRVLAAYDAGWEGQQEQYCDACYGPKGDCGCAIGYADAIAERRARAKGPRAWLVEHTDGSHSLFFTREEIEESELSVKTSTPLFTHPAPKAEDAEDCPTIHQVAQARIAELEALLKECHATMNHAEVFIATREKMHPTGQELYRELLEQIDEALTGETR